MMATEQLILEISNDKQNAKIVRLVISNLSYYKLMADTQSYLFLEIEDAWKCLKYQFPEWYLLHLAYCSEKIRPLIKTDFFAELVIDRPVYENWLVVLIGYGIHWI